MSLRDYLEAAEGWGGTEKLCHGRSRKVCIIEYTQG